VAKSFQEAGLYGGEEMDNLREKLQQKQQEKQQGKQNDEIDRPAIREIDPRAVLAATLVIAIVAAGVGLSSTRDGAAPRSPRDSRTRFQTSTSFARRSGSLSSGL